MVGRIETDGGVVAKRPDGKTFDAGAQSVATVFDEIKSLFFTPIRNNIGTVDVSQSMSQDYRSGSGRTSCHDCFRSYVESIEIHINENRPPAILNDRIDRSRKACCGSN